MSIRKMIFGLVLALLSIAGHAATATSLSLLPFVDCTYHTCPVGTPPYEVGLSNVFLMRFVATYGDMLPANYTSTVVFTSSDPTVTIIPSSHTFDPSENGLLYVFVQFNSMGSVAGAYPSSTQQTVTATDAANNLSVSYSVGVLPQDPQPISKPQDITGAWYDPTVGGQGLMLDVSSDASGTPALNGGWFTYTVPTRSGQVEPLWFSLQSQAAPSVNAFPLAIYSTKGGAFDSLPVVGPTLVGTATLQFADCHRALFEYSLKASAINSPAYPVVAQAGIVNLVRLSNDAGCQTDTSITKSSRGFSGTWYDPSISGQGLLFDVSDTAGGFFFGGWFTFDTLGMNQAWYTLQGPFALDATEADIPVYQGKSESFRMTQTPAGGYPDTFQVGTAHVKFTSCTDATLTYSTTFPSSQALSGSIPLKRITPAPPDCPL